MINPKHPPERKPEDLILLLVLASWLLFIGVILLSGCAHVCAKTWETGASVEHSAFFGPSYGTHVTLGGELGPSQCKAAENQK